MSLLSVLLSPTFQSSLRYEPYDARLCCLGQSLVTALASADRRREVVMDLLRLLRLSLSRCVSCTIRLLNCM